MPPMIAEVWRWFLDLNRTRASGFGASPISYSEMAAYFNFIDIKPLDWEFEMLQMFDRIALETYTEDEKK